jgi:RHH-type proline utilization regulon transcriptional repressor/proline dehydrogenase/delta 1-pyrroline-5-carboxylate dehydrogenase
MRAAIRSLYRADEAACVEALLPRAALPDELAASVAARARVLVEHIRSHRREAGGLDAFLQTYALDTEEGVILMCLAEALLRIPDEETANRLIRDKIGEAAWGRHLGESESHAHFEPAIRHGPDHRGRTGTRQASRSQGLSSFLRHAGRGGAHGR